MNPQFEELACRYVLDRLDPLERADFEARLNREPELVAWVREYETAYAREIHALPQLTPAPAMLARIEQEIRRTSGLVRPSFAMGSSSRWAVLTGWGIAAVIAVGVTTLAVRSVWPGSAAPAAATVVVVGLDAGRSTRTELSLRADARDADGRFIQLATLAEDYWENPERMPARSGPVRTGAGYAVFDPGANQGFIGIRQLPPASPGKRYHLWVVDAGSGGLRDAGALPAADSSRGLFFFSLPQVAATDKAAARYGFIVTEEDVSGPEANHPAGRVVLGGARL